MSRSMVIIIVVLLVLGCFADNSRTIADNSQEKKLADADVFITGSTAQIKISSEDGKIILLYPDGQTDTLKGKQVEEFIENYPFLMNEERGSVYKTEISRNGTTCTQHFVLVHSRQIRFTTVSC